MADQKLLDILASGVAEWNEWRANNPTVPLELSEANLKDANLIGADLRGASLRGANLAGSNLSTASLSSANLSRASLSSAYLQDAYLQDAYLNLANLKDTYLNNAILNGADLRGADLSGAMLTSAMLNRADLKRANLRRAKLGSADLGGADLVDADLSSADLNCAILVGTILSGANLALTNFSLAYFGNAALLGVDLSTAKGLDSANHASPSSIGIDTLYKSSGKISEVFLRGCGVPDDFITFIPSIIGAQQAIQFYSCFISYSTKDEEFSRQLYSRMRDEHLRVWFAPEDIKGGEKLNEQIERAIQIHDRLLIVLSENSLKSEWVMTEIRKARKAEIKEKRRKLFPIRLIDYETIKKWKCFDADSGKDLAVEVREYFIPDFTNWKDHDAFEKNFNRLLRDLRAEESKQIKP